MSRLSFTNGAMLAGLAVLVIPILIHLLLRRTRTRLRFSTLQFFIQQDEQSERRRKLRHWLLLATRLLLLAVLVLAFARPYLPNGAIEDPARPRRQVVLVLDRSASLQTGNRWARMMEAVRQSLAELGMDDRVALVVCAANAEVAMSLAPPAKLRPLLDKLEPGFGTSDVAEGLRAALKLLASEPAHLKPAIWVFSDLQRNACQRLRTASLPRDLEVKTWSAGEPDAANFAVQDLVVPVESGAASQVSLVNFSAQDAKEVKMDWLIDGEFISRQSAAVRAGTTTNLGLSLPALPPGWHTAEARIQSQDGLALDDSARLAFQIPDAISVLCVESRPSKRVFEEESFFVVSALNPGQGDSNRISARFKIEKVLPERLTSRLRDQPKEQQLVILPSLRQMPSEAGSILEGFVKNGGGLVIFAGEGIQAGRYSLGWRDLLPAVLERVEDVPLREQAGWHVREYARDNLIFAAFRQPNSGDLALPVFSRRWAMTPVESSQVLARFDDGAPLLVSRTVGAGRVLLVNTSADTRWNDWPKRKTFVPWLHGVANFAAGEAFAEKGRDNSRFLAGMATEIDLGRAAARKPFLLQTPGSAQTMVVADAEGRLPILPGPPGFYSLSETNGRLIRLCAANLPSAESDLAAWTLQEFQQQLAQAASESGTGPAAWVNPELRDREFWRMILTAGLVLLCLEIILANRTFA